MASDTAMLLIACPCGQRMKVPGDAIGKTASCVKCGKKLRITGETASADPNPSPPQAPRRMTPSGTDIPDAIDILLQEGLANAQAVREALILQQDLGLSAWEIMGRLGRYTFEDFHALMARQKRVAAIDIVHYDIPNDVLATVPEDLTRRGKLIPVDKLGKLLTIAMVCPLDTERVFEVEQITGLKVKPMLATHEAMERALNRYHPLRWDSEWPPYLDGALKEEFKPILDNCPKAMRLLSTSQFPLLPETQHVFSLSKNMKDGLQKRSDAVLHDPAALARILGLANTSAFGMPGSVDSPALACAMLGNETLDELFLGDNAEDSEFWTREEGLLDELTRETRFAVALARSTCHAMGDKNVDRASAIAALQTLGRFAMAYLFRSSYATVAATERGLQRLARERRAYNITSREAGYLLARSWMLPGSLYASVSPFTRLDSDDETKHNVEFGRFIELSMHRAFGDTNGNDSKPDSATDPGGRLGLAADEIDRLVQAALQAAGGTHSAA